MGLKKLAEKLANYNARLERGMTKEIKPDHVHTVLKKLRKQYAELETEWSSETKAEKKERLARKLGVAREQVTRAEWLLQQIEPTD
jgi:hypothetical protein